MTIGTFGITEFLDSVHHPVLKKNREHNISDFRIPDDGRSRKT
jgi:hypothetical protein